MFSYLLQLGWSAKNDEDYSVDRATKLFALENVSKSPAKFDLKKLNNINAKNLNSMKISDIYKLVIDRFKLSLNDEEQKRFKQDKLHSYDPNYWKDYSVIEPNQAIKSFKVNSN